MTSTHEIRIPREIVNDDVVAISAWLVASGDHVSRRQTVAEIETSKAVVEVEADADGFIEILQSAGAGVEVGALIGRIVAAPKRTAPRPEPFNDNAASPASTMATNAAPLQGPWLSKRAGRGSEPRRRSRQLRFPRSRP